MKNINSLHVSRLSNGDFYQFIENIVDIVIDNPLTMAIAQTLANDVQPLLNSYQKEHLTLETKKIAELDHKRDRAYLKFKGIVEAHSYDDAVRANLQASEKLETIINHYGGSKLTSFDYNKETASITGLIQDVRIYAAHETQILHLNDSLGYLESCNNEFKTFYASRNEAASALANLVPFYKLRREVTTHYKNFTCDLESLQRFLPEDAHRIEDIITRVNVEIDKFSLLIPAAATSNGHTTELPRN